MSHTDRLLAPREVAALFEVTPKTVGRWADAGVLPVERTRGGHRRFAAEAVTRLIDVLQEVGEQKGAAGSVLA